MRAATAQHGDLRGDLRTLAEVTPALVEAYEELPHALVHGDATLDNLHEPGSGDIVAIDLSYVCPEANIGSGARRSPERRNHSDVGRLCCEAAASRVMVWPRTSSRRISRLTSARLSRRRK